MARVQRRYFCKLMAAAAAARAVPTIGQTDGAAQSAAFQSLNTYTEDYAAYCAKPADQRVFYAYEGGQIIQEKLDEKTWTPTGWGKPPSLPIPGGSWDGVPMVSPIPNLAGKARTSPRGIPYCNTMRRNGIATPSSGSGPIGVPSVCLRMAIGMRAICTCKDVKTK